MQIIFFIFLCLEPHDTYVFFKTFFSQVNKKIKIMVGGFLGTNERKM